MEMTGLCKSVENQKKDFPPASHKAFGNPVNFNRGMGFPHYHAAQAPPVMEMCKSLILNRLMEGIGTFSHSHNLRLHHFFV
jgi:hypothetical protein